MRSVEPRAERGPRRNAAKERLWRGHLAQQRKSGLSIREYCDRAGISEPSFYAWRRALAEREPASAPLDQQTETPRPAPRRAPAVRRETQSPASPTSFLPVTIAPTAAGPIELALPSGLVIRVPAYDLGALRTVLDLLEGGSC